MGNKYNMTAAKRIVIGGINYMNKKVTLLISIILLILLVVGCGNQKIEEGLNPVTLKQLEKKLADQETFVFMTFVASEEHVKKTKLIEAYHESLKQAGLKVFYVNLEGESEQAIVDLSEKYTHVDMGGPWSPDRDGLMLSENGKVVGSVKSLTSENIENRANEVEGYGTDFFYSPRQMESEVELIFEMIKEYNLELTY